LDKNDDFCQKTDFYIVTVNKGESQCRYEEAVKSQSDEETLLFRFQSKGLAEKKWLDPCSLVVVVVGKSPHAITRVCRLVAVQKKSPVYTS